MAPREAQSRTTNMGDNVYIGVVVARTRERERGIEPTEAGEELM